jgi:PadR family transcriptional regulator, regulatory protein PadR
MPPRTYLTYTTALVLQALSQGVRYGFDIMDDTGLPSGTVYPVLRRLERLRLVEARWEDEATAQRDGRPARRYYELTADGRALLDEARRRFHHLAARHPAGGDPSPA